MTKRLILITSLITVACILMIWVCVPSTLVFDGVQDDYARTYAPVARNLINGKGYTLNGTISLEYPPGYSLFLSAVFYTGNILHIPETVSFNVAKMILMVAANICILMISLLYWKDKRAILSSVLWISYPLMLWIPCQRNSELLFLPVFYAALYLLLRLHQRSQTNRQAMVFAVCSGALFGLASLVRPIVLFLPLLIFLVYLATSGKKVSYKLVHSMCFFTAGLVVILPWEIWIHVKTGDTILLGKRDVKSIYDGLTFDRIGNDYRKELKLPNDVKSFMQDIAVNGSTAYKTKDDILRKVFQQFRRAPGTIIKLYTIKAFRVWYGTHSTRFENKILVIQILYTVFWLLLLIKALGSRELRQYGRYILFMIVYFWGMSVIVMSIVRYMVPVLGLLFVFTPAILEYGPVMSLYTKVQVRLKRGKRYFNKIICEK